MKKFGKSILVILMIINGLLFVSNIYVLGDHQGAIKMHDDLASTASAFMANLKVLNCFFVGILYLISAFGIIKKRYHLTLAGVLGALHRFAAARARREAHGDADDLVAPLGEKRGRDRGVDTTGHPDHHAVAPTRIRLSPDARHCAPPLRNPVKKGS